jgi:nucleotide-binding universal stress UspA family protein
MVEEAKQEASKWFTEIQKNAEQQKVLVKTGVIDTPLSVVGGIVNYSERENADLIVIGTRGRSGLTKLLLGSVASGVVTYAPCPVMVAR